MLVLRCVVFVVFHGFSAALHAATPLPAPNGEVLLRVTGDIAEALQPEAAFDREMLAELGERTIETTTPWTRGKQSFTGVPLHDLLDRLGVEDGTLRVIALNDYAASVPVEDAVEDGPILAYARNGEEMTIRDKGPLWLIYPYDSDNNYRTETIFARSVWQVGHIEVDK
ncbi:molybdopterin-dependent oxidoreductase [Tranquillimonas alkanivorans]|uniref:Oxidoreductase molybdopterin-binding domain-containing protein n=1 Tax=Tranquillimonas alkanivorans TaxID=441119 RepID=A0A1I5MXY2_9RHOB|nr:molybdopterin-dependent oxidoreductase [Tranquillimonas alkanivorans]SFP14394.1 hypothetical protein SAMN04488047_1033 [Tranquillimonas alkanivorans]